MAMCFLSQDDAGAWYEGPDRSEHGAGIGPERGPADGGPGGAVRIRPGRCFLSGDQGG